MRRLDNRHQASIRRALVVALAFILGCDGDEPGEGRGGSGGEPTTAGATGSGGRGGAPGGEAGDTSTGSRGTSTGATPGAGGLAPPVNQPPNAGATPAAKDAGASDGAPNAPPPPGCRLPSDCSEDDVCNVDTGACVECTANRHCDENEECVAEQCAPVPVCDSSSDCDDRTDGRTVCHSTNESCVECQKDEHCPPIHECIGARCLRSCQGDSICSPYGLRCEPFYLAGTISAGDYCVECSNSLQCKLTEYCESARCLPDVCVAGLSECDPTEPSIRLVCNVDGSALEPEPCPAGTHCARDDGHAVCVADPLTDAGSCEILADAGDGGCNACPCPVSDAGKN